MEKNKKMSELYELPAGWEWKKLGDVFDVKDGTHDSPKYKAIGHPLVTSKNLKNNSLDLNSCKFISEDDFAKINQRSKVDKGDLLFAMIGTVGSPTIVDFKPNFAIKNVALFKPNDMFLIELLKYWLSSYIVVRKMLGEAKGATQKFVGLTYLRNFPIPLPPLAEQKRIVAKLDSLFEKIDKAIELHQQNITNVNTLIASTLDKTFKKLEGEYKLESLEKLIKIIGGGTPSKSNKSYWNGSIKWATVRDMKVNTIVETEHSITEEALKRSSSNIVPKDAIVIATRVGLGKVCYLNGDTAINQDLKGLLPDTELLNLRYLFNFFKAIETYIVDNGTGATVKGVKLDFIKSIKIPLPPLQIQQQTVAYLDSIATKVDEIKKLNEQKLENLKALKASILDKAFRGEL